MSGFGHYARTADELEREIVKRGIAIGLDWDDAARLRELADRLGVPAYMVEDATELQPEWFAGTARVGLTAGASAPDILVQQVIDRLRAMGAVSIRKMDGVQESVRFPLPRGLGDRSMVDAARVLSPDGRYLSFGTTRNGEANPTLRVFDLERMRLLPDTIPWPLWADANGFRPRWLADSSGFFYVRRPDADEAMGDTERARGGQSGGWTDRQEKVRSWSVTAQRSGASRRRLRGVSRPEGA